MSHLNWSRFNHYLHFAIFKHILIGLTLLNAVDDIDNYHKYGYNRPRFYLTPTNTTAIDLQKHCFDENSMEKLPMNICNAVVFCNARSLVEAVYNIIFLFIIIKEVLKGIRIFFFLEISLYIFNWVISVGIFDIFCQARNGSLYWFIYIVIVSLYRKALNRKIEEKEWRNRIIALEAELNFPFPSIAG